MSGHSEQSAGEGEKPMADFGDDFFERMVASAGDAVVTADEDGTLVYANAAVEDLLGYDPAEVRGKRFAEFVPERLRDRYDGWFDRYTDGEGGTPLDDERYELTWVGADGEEVRLSVSGFVHESDDRQWFTGFLREADDDASAERLREEEALIEEIFDTSPIAFAVRDEDGDLLRANERAAELVGVGGDSIPDDGDREWTVYDADGELLPDDEYPVNRVLETGEPVYNETVVVEQPSGRRVHLSVSAAPVREGDEVRRVVSAAEDVTELKETQFELERRREELETELSEVFSRIADAFFALDEDWNFTYVNEEAEELLNESEEELVGESIWEAFPESVGTTFQEEYERAMENQKPASFVEYYPPLSAWFEVQAYPSESGLSVYFQDVSGRIERKGELQNHVKQQRAVADFSQAALEDRPLDDLFDEAVELVCETLGHDYCKVLELDPEAEELLLRNGVGWRDGIVGEATVANDRRLLAGYTLVSEEPVVVTDLENEDRFSGPELLTSHDVTSGITAIVGSPDEPWGVLGTHHTDEQDYADHDVQFVQSIAHILTTAIQRRERERRLERYETIVETVEDGVYALDSEERFVMVNDALCELTGYDREELLGEPASVVHSEAISEKAAEMSDEVTDDFGSVMLELELTRKDGDSVPVESRFGPYRDDGGAFARTGVVRDITERKAREEELQNRVGQQRALSEFSQHALEDRPLDDLMDEATELVAETLDHEFSKLLQLRPEEDDLLLRAGYNWDEAEIGSVTVGTEHDSQAGYTLLAGEPVVVEDFPNEDRFSYPDLNASRGMKSGVSIIVGSPDDPWGILETHTTERRSYADYEVQFVQSIAHILSTAIRRRDREQQLERYETVIETVEDGIYIVGPDGTFSMVNSSFAQLVGYDRADLVGTSPARLYDGEIVEKVEELQQEIRNGERASATVEHDLYTGSGGSFPAETTFTLRRTETGYERVGVTRDITERKRFEQTLTALHESSRELLQLETADAVAKSVLQTTTDVLGIRGAGIYLYDEEREKLTPAAVSEYVADLFDDLPAFEEGDEALTWRAFADGETIRFDDVANTDLTYRDDTPLRSGLWIPLGDHGVLAVVSTEIGAFDADDRTLADLLAATTEAALDRVERERERRRHERELEAQNERLDAFASMLAHELRNPLEIAQIYLDMGVESTVGGDADASSFREVERALDRIEEMIETLLVVTRRGGSVETTEALNLGGVAREWWDDLAPGGTLVVETDREIVADSSRLRQLLENLYRNAEEHAGPDATVRVGDLPDGSASEASGASTDESVGGFYVEDDGPGIPEDERGEVFDPGYSTSNVGIGFGLAVVEQLVEAHRWDCTITESEAGGARFEFTNVETPDE
ncbi:PAS domain S-box protein [Halorussus gelatinilyticus]|uniref:histidine kinase n=1 Tax=Halorussus gelatinilyticus TaxID=2937524 RepID=A0A8U0ILI8_9EURY|nr:PAS domain S-box protein [Halorussus gelatinilyticus]UPW01997.1 PAS domain S-box protein [Halorussus gelatinilyticus]